MTTLETLSQAIRDMIPETLTHTKTNLARVNTPKQFFTIHLDTRETDLILQRYYHDDTTCDTYDLNHPDSLDKLLKDIQDRENALP